MAGLERQARAPVGFVAASTGPEGGLGTNRPQNSADDAPVSTVPVVVNPDVINLDDAEE